MGFSSWTELPQHVLDLVLHKLQSPSDYARFSVVCMWWNFVARDHLRRRTRLTGPPMLLTYSGKEETWNLCDMRNEKVLDLQLELPNIRFCGFSEGWLIFFDENFIVTLVDPFTRVIGRRGNRNSMVGLPQLHPPRSTESLRTRVAPYCDFYVHKAIITADPVLNAKDCIIVVVYGHLLWLAFIRLGADTKWTYVDQTNICRIRDIVYIEDKLYAVDVANRLFCFDITTSQYIFTLVGEGFERPAGKWFKTYLVESSDQKELLMVHRYMGIRRRSRRREPPRLTKKFKVFKFEADNHKWNRIRSLGDVSLFVGDSVMSVMTSYFNGFLPNCIYFIHDWDISYHRQRHRDYGVYDMTNKDIYHFKDASTPIKMSNRTPMWTMAKLRL